MIFPADEVLDALNDHNKKPNDQKQLLHLEALLTELLENIRQAVVKNIRFDTQGDISK